MLIAPYIIKACNYAGISQTDGPEIVNSCEDAVFSPHQLDFKKKGEKPAYLQVFPNN
ncbi:hypothetical protein [Paenibacillus motobuensis]|uniref:Uncharacterized protein n=1 Tax=Paenibacillus motobuensis TaxID=295324 RepID=A0ABP3I4P6_9BACL